VGCFSQVLDDILRHPVALYGKKSYRFAGMGDFFCHCGFVVVIPGKKFRNIYNWDGSVVHTPTLTPAIAQLNAVGFDCPDNNHTSMCIIL
jgi:hypothetical protein